MCVHTYKNSQLQLCIHRHLKFTTPPPRTNLDVLFPGFFFLLFEVSAAKVMCHTTVKC